MGNPEQLPPLGSPELRRALSVDAPKDHPPDLSSLAKSFPPQPPMGSPLGASRDCQPLSEATERALEEADARERDVENKMAGQLLTVPEWRVPAFVAGTGLLLGVIAIFSLLGLFVFAQTLTIFAQIAVLPEWARWISYILLTLLLAGVASAIARFFLIYCRLRLTRRINLGGFAQINLRAQLRDFAAAKTQEAYRLVSQYLEDFPTDLDGLTKIGFTQDSAATLIKCREDLADPSKELGPGEWLTRFRNGFQSIVDEAAEDCTKRHARRVGLAASAVPIPMLDTAIVLYGSFKMIERLCQLYRLRLGPLGTLTITGWAVFQSMIAARVENWNGTALQTWEHDFHQHLGVVADSSRQGVAQGVSSVMHAVGDGHVPFIGPILKRASKGFLQYVLLRRLGLLTQRWMRMVN